MVEDHSTVNLFAAVEPGSHCLHHNLIVLNGRLRAIQFLATNLRKSSSNQPKPLRQSKSVRFTQNSLRGTDLNTLYLYLGERNSSWE